MSEPVLTGRIDDDKGRPRNVYTLPGYGLTKTAFGEQSVAMNEPIIQASANYNLIPANFRQFTATGGSTSASDGMFVCQTGTSVGGRDGLADILRGFVMTPTARFNKRTGEWEPYEVRSNAPKGPIVISDIADYVSPLSEPGQPPVVISGRRERREELRRNNLREVDPSEWKGGK